MYESRDGSPQLFKCIALLLGNRQEKSTMAFACLQGESDATQMAGIMTALAYSSHLAGFISGVSGSHMTRCAPWQ
jgi:hypothetical protein